MKRHKRPGSALPWVLCAALAMACGGTASSIGLDGSGGDAGGDGGGDTAGGGGAPGGSGASSAVGGASQDGSGGGSPGAGGQAVGGDGTGGDGTGGDAGSTGGDGAGGDAGSTGGDTGSGGTTASACTCLDAECGQCPDAPMVFIDDGNYWIDATEVTNEQYADFLAAEPSLALQPAECGFNGTFVPSSQWPAAAQRAEHPVVWVNWCDAYAFCAWAGKRLCGAIGGGPSPYASFQNASVNQWYNACSAGGASVYPYGDDYDADACNSSSTDLGDSWAAGSVDSCEGGSEGLFDMSGNVWEWEDSCADASGPLDNCRARGGSFWTEDTLLMRCRTATSSYQRSRNSRNLGFRCCADVTED